MSGFTTSEQAAYLLKKALGRPSTLETTAAFSEPNRSARSAVFQSQILAEQIPDVAPADLVSATLDDLGAALAGSAAGRTSATSPMVRKYVNVALEEVLGSNGMAYEAADDPVYGRVLQDSIPYGYDPAGSYLVTIYKSDGTSVIAFGSGDWLLDPDSGILTFYGTLPTGVSSVAPPKVSFYRYVGSKGASTAEQTAAAIEAQSLSFSQPITFIGGSTSLADDALTAVQLDTRDYSTLTSSEPGMALQIGGDANGSWRITVYGGGGTASTRFAIECRVGGAWVTKTSLTAS